MARPDNTRGLRDEANVGPDPRAARELKRLSDLRYDVSDGDPDVRGWAVWASTGRELGVVDDLLVDVEAGEVVMVDVDLKRDDRHAYAPLRAAWIDHATRRVVLDARAVESAMGDDLLPGLPRSGALTDADVDQFNDGYARAWGDRGAERDHDWRVRHGDDELRFGARRPAAGG
ncbi:MAG TPA: PRC-barrel domain-containing protein, partial [Gemmatirosa sp.]|nr:PRC-barrel domain-containing protein [Gemmatirosa sp.]